jgi:hypothetical protein
MCRPFQNHFERARSEVVQKFAIHLRGIVQELGKVVPDAIHWREENEDACGFTSLPLSKRKTKCNTRKIKVFMTHVIL